jgi:trans-aconitate 2-methyltransferase
MQVPFRTGPADLIYCRYLLSHLADPELAVDRWGSQLKLGGLLMLEEVESIETDKAVFSDYIGIVDAMLKSQSNRLYAGADVAGLHPDSLTQVGNELREVRVSNSAAAEMFALNLRAWRDGEFVRSHYAPESVSRIARELEEIAGRASQESEIRWLMRQAVFRR